MRRLTLFFGLLTTGCNGGSGDDLTEPTMEFTLATSGAVSISETFDTNMNATAGWSGDESDCNNVQRGVRGQSDSGISFEFTISGCTVLSEGGPAITLPGQLTVTQSGGESFNSAYYDGQNDEFVDGCVVAIANVWRWEESPWHDEHLYADGTYSCATLYSGFSEGDPELTVNPGTFSIDWTSSEL